jgi:hypothetical protein
MPQWLVLVWRLASQPLDALASQSPKPEAQAAMVHTLAAQAPVALAGAQRLLQAPQLLRSVAVTASQPVLLSASQLEKPDSHAKVHAPLEQVTRALGPVGHALLQRPQWATSVPSARSHPLAGSPSQSLNPLRQTKPQRPAAHDATLLGRTGHIAPHPPQWRTSLAVNTSHPLPGLPSQSA